ncbi:hypothetical protein J6590_029943 [Homalodisca vitripennis]|nr:hypothetical protein J6590_029943 [Homalodisca vitripennis]
MRKTMKCCSERVGFVRECSETQSQGRNNTCEEEEELMSDHMRSALEGGSLAEGKTCGGGRGDCTASAREVAGWARGGHLGSLATLSPPPRTLAAISSYT